MRLYKVESLLSLKVLFIIPCQMRNDKPVKINNWTKTMIQIK